jgi:hypothetical protein
MRLLLFLKLPASQENVSSFILPKKSSMTGLALPEEE